MAFNPIFEDFADYWHYMKHLSERQRSLIFSNLPKDQQQFIEESYEKGGWDDLFYRNEVDNILDDLKKKYGYDVFEIRSKALKGKSVYVPSKFWELLIEYLKAYRKEDVKFVLSGLHAIPCKVNKDVVLVVSSASNLTE